MKEMDLKTWCVNHNRKEIIAEWNGLLNDRAIKTHIDKVPFDSQEYAIWNCQVCGRTTFLTILERIAQEGNLKCAGCIQRENIKRRALKRNEPITMIRKIQSSLPEQYMFFYLKQEKLELIKGATFDWLGRSSLDLYFPELTLAIEYDGSYWHYDGVDEDKTKLCLKHGISIIRVREDAIPIKDKSKLVILYKQDKTYSNIHIPILQIIDYLNKTYNLALKYPDVNIERDQEEILQFIAEQAKKKSIAYRWPEIYRYWDYEKNEGILPEDITKSTNLFFWMKCPHCGEHYKMKPIYYNHSMLNCECEYTVDNYKSYYLYLKNYFDKHGNLMSNERSLLARRALDWIDTLMKRQYRNIPYEEIQALRDIGLQYPYRENPNYISPLFRERTAEEQQKYRQFKIDFENKIKE